MPKSNSLDAMFDNKEPLVRDLYERLLAKISKFGTFEAQLKKTSIHLVRQTAFAGVHPKKAWLDVTIRSAVAIQSGRLRHQEQVSKNRWHQDVRLEKPGDIDSDMTSWLRSAYDLAG
jgi:hypothetical protein